MLSLRRAVSSVAQHAHLDPLTAALARADEALACAEEVRAELDGVRGRAEQLNAQGKARASELASELRAGLRKVRTDIASEVQGALARQIAEVAAEGKAMQVSVTPPPPPFLVLTGQVSSLPSY
jgi:hypothetical protein